LRERKGEREMVSEERDERTIMSFDVE